MLGPFILIAYRLMTLSIFWLPPTHREGLKARWALSFAAMTDGGLDDDFAEQVFLLVLGRPALLPELERRSQGSGLFAMRRRMVLQTIHAALNSGRQSLFS